MESDMNFTIENVGYNHKTYETYKRYKEYNSALEAIDDNRVANFSLSKDKKKLTIEENCDNCFYLTIKKKDFLEFKNKLNIELNEFYENMVE